MGSSPKPPKPADPKETAGAQTATNIGTAIAQQQLANTNQVTPYGSLTFDQRGEYLYTDPNTGDQHVIPQYSATQTFSPEQQGILDQTLVAERNLADLGASQSGRLNDLLGRPLDVSGIPAAGDPSAVRRADLQRQVAAPQFQNAPGGPQLQGASAGPSFNAFAGAPSLGTVGQGPSFDRAGQGADLRNETSRANLTGSIADAGDITRTYGTDFSQDRQRVEDALFERVNPQLREDRQRLETRLAAQGINIGSEAYNRAMLDHSRRVNDARLGIVAQGGAEQSRLAQLEAQRAGFQNAAQSQAFGQNLTGTQFGNQVAQQRSDNDLRANQFFNQTSQAEAADALQRGQINNQLSQQQADNALRATGFNNQATQQSADNAFRTTGANNQLSQQSADNALQRTGFSNQVAQQQADNALRSTAFNNDLATTGANFGLQQAAFGNQAALAQTQADTQAFDAQNAARNQALQQEFAIRNQPLNEITALLSGAQVQQPNFVNTPTAQIANTDFAGLQANYDAQRQAQYQQQVASRNSLFGGALGLAGNLGGALIASDRRVKQDIKKVGKTDDGQSVYRFRYKGGGPIQLGLMAQEVEKRKPDAVQKVGGIKMVDYGKALR